MIINEHNERIEFDEDALALSYKYTLGAHGTCDCGENPIFVLATHDEVIYCCYRCFMNIDLSSRFWAGHANVMNDVVIYPGPDGRQLHPEGALI